MDDIEIVEFDGRELTDGVNYYGNPPHEDEVYDFHMLFGRIPDPQSLP